MIALNTPTKLPKKYIWYGLTKIVLICFLAALPVSFLNPNIGNGIFIGLLLIFGLPVGIYFVLQGLAVSFIIDEHKINVDSGIIVKRSKATSFNNVQSVSNTAGILRRIFGLVKVNIWTASPAQIRIRDNESQHRPDESLYLDKNIAKWLKNFILTKRHV